MRWPDTPFTEDMLDDPRGVLVKCPTYSDAEELDAIIRDHGIVDWSGNLMERFESCAERYPDDDVCFEIRDKRLAENPDYYFQSVGYCYLSYFFALEDYKDYIRCTFYPGAQGTTEIPDDGFEEILRGGGES